MRTKTSGWDHQKATSRQIWNKDCLNARHSRSKELSPSFRFLGGRKFIRRMMRGEIPSLLIIKKHYRTPDDHHLDDTPQVIPIQKRSLLLRPLQIPGPGSLSYLTRLLQWRKRPECHPTDSEAVFQFFHSKIWYEEGTELQWYGRTGGGHTDTWTLVNTPKRHQNPPQTKQELEHD